MRKIKFVLHYKSNGKRRRTQKTIKLKEIRNGCFVYDDEVILKVKYDNSILKHMNIYYRKQKLDFDIDVENMEFPKGGNLVMCDIEVPVYIIGLVDDEL